MGIINPLPVLFLRLVVERGNLIAGIGARVHHEDPVPFTGGHRFPVLDRVPESGGHRGTPCLVLAGH